MPSGFTCFYSWTPRHLPKHYYDSQLTDGKTEAQTRQSSCLRSPGWERKKQDLSPSQPPSFTYPLACLPCPSQSAPHLHRVLGYAILSSEPPGASCLIDPPTLQPVGLFEPPFCWLENWDQKAFPRIHHSITLLQTPLFEGQEREMVKDMSLTAWVQIPCFITL